MFRKCNENDYKLLTDYLKKEQILNTFIISDLDNYGFHKPFQVCYMDTDERGACMAVALIFHNNLIISGQVASMDFPFLSTLLTEQINNVMGSGELVSALHKYLGGSGRYIEKTMYTIDTGLQLQQREGVQLATLEDVDAIHNFISTIPEISFLYPEKSMISNRIQSGEGVHLFIKEKGEIVAHANSAAGTDISSMVGGVAVAPEFRHLGYGKGVVSAAVDYVLNQKRTACLFAQNEQDHNLFIELGFQPYKKWGTLGL